MQHANDPADDLPSAILEAEQDLIESVEKACALEPRNPGEESTGELKRLEDALADATRAATRAVELRHRRRAQVGNGEDAGDTPGVREFHLASGQGWRVWAVNPARGEGTRSILERLEPEYRNGWLAFETIDGGERRRLAGYPAEWVKLDEKELAALLERARPVVRRATRRRRD